MLIAASPLLRALLAPAPAAVGGARDTETGAGPAPLAPGFALVAAGYGFGPMAPRAARRPERRKDSRRERRQ